MNQDYIKQLEEANEDLRNLLDRERFLRRVEINRNNRFYRVVLQYFTLEDITICSQTDSIFPARSYDDVSFVTVRGLTAARDVLSSSIPAHKGVYWRIDHLKNNQESKVILSGWFSFFSEHPSVGGDFFKFNFELDNGVIRYDKFSDYCKYIVSQIKNERLDNYN